MQPSGSVYILLKDKEQAEKTTRVMGLSVPRQLHTSTCHVLKGELITPIPFSEMIPRSDGQKIHNYHTLTKDSPATFYDEDNGLNQAPLSPNEYDVLAAIKLPHVRFNTFIEEGKLGWGTKLKIGDKVTVELPVLGDAAPNKATPRAMAVIRYVGPVRTLPGITFGVEIKDKNFFGWGSTNGYFQGEQYFECRDDFGLFVSLDKLYPSVNDVVPLTGGQINPPPAASAHSHHLQATPRNIGRQNNDDMGSRYRYKSGDRVVFFSKKDVPIHGTVKWVGMYGMKHGPLKTVGIETDVKIKNSEVQSFPKKDHYFQAAKDKSAVFLSENEVLPEADFAERPPEKPSVLAPHGHNQQLQNIGSNPGHGYTHSDPSQRPPPHGQHPASHPSSSYHSGEAPPVQYPASHLQAQYQPPPNSNLQGQERMLQQYSEQKKKEDKRKMSDSGLTRREMDHMYDNADILAQPSVPARQPFHDLEHHISHGQHPASHPSSSYHSGEAPPVQYPASHLQAQYQPPPNSNYANMLPQDMEHPPPQHHHQYYPAGSSSTMNTQQPSIQSGQHKAYAGPPDQTFSAGLGVGSPVQLIQDPNRTGVIKWIGPLREIKGTIAGVELDGPMEGCDDGVWRGHRYFTCVPGRALFCPVTSLRPDSRIPQPSNPATIALQVSKYKQSRGLDIETAIHKAGSLITDLQETGRILGKGSYGVVVEVKVNQRLCAAKKLHDIFNAQDVPLNEKTAMSKRFEKECRQVLYLKHPNVVEMIGVYFDPATQSPTLVMELMDTSLCSYLETNSKSSVHLATKYGILHDVASGLVYLHTLPPPLGPIVHRDLTANNILLNLQWGEVIAKIGDLGQAKNDPVYATRRQQLSKVPGNEAHMPPEASFDNPVYNASLDVFSFGVVILHTLTHEWPKPLGRMKSATEIRLEVDRRKPFLDKIEGNPLKPLVIQCLSQESKKRPATNDVFLGLSVATARYFNPLDVPQWEEEDQAIEGDQYQRYQGDWKGIQGHQNSCYIDATIFGLFALSDVFDTLFLYNSMTSFQLLTPVTPAQLVQSEIGSMLWKGIVNPLRKNGAVRYESVMKLRNKLEELGKMEGVNTSEKDPEEFLNMLFKHTLHVDPFIQIKRPFGTEPEFFVQLFLKFDESLKIPTIEKLLGEMFKEQQISFTEVPSKLLVQVPRYGKQFQTYKRIIPGIKFDPNPLIDIPTYLNTCFFCGEQQAQYNCKECKQFFTTDDDTVYFCNTCNELVHKHKERVSHKSEKCQHEGADELELLSVLCIETSHYVCFSRDSQGRWLFFDSMANRVFDQYNIPRGVDCTAQLNDWVYEGDQERLMTAGHRELPELVRRFTQDVYMCIYIQPDYGMYG